MIIVVLSCLISVAATVLIVLMVRHTLELDRRVKLKRYRHQDRPALADLLNYAAVVDDGVIACKNGALMAAWVYRGNDMQSTTAAETESLVMRVNQALAPLSDGWMLHIDAVRSPTPHYVARGSSHFPDMVSRAIDEERRAFFESLGTMYESNFVVTVTWLPPLLAQRKFVELMYEDDGTKAKTPKQITQKLLGQFKAEVTTLESRLSLAVKNIQRLRGEMILHEDGRTTTQDHFLAYLHYCVTGLDHPIQLPRNPMYLDGIIGGQDLHTGTVPKIGRKYIQTIAIEGFPLESYPGLLSILADLPLQYRWSNRFIVLDQHQALRHFEAYRRKWRQKIRGFMDQVFNTHTGPVDQDALSMVADAEEAVAEINSGFVSYGYFTSVVVVMDEDRDALDAAVRFITKQIQKRHFTARVEEANTMEAYLGSLPGHGVENVRRPLVHTLNLADLLPLSTAWTGSQQAPSPLYPPESPPLAYAVTSGQTAFCFNLHVRDLAHTIILGPTGSGKSTFLGLVIAQFRRYRDTSIFVFDKGESSYVLTKALGGQHFPISADQPALAFSPLQYLDTKQDRAWALEWLETILQLNDLTPTASQRNMIAEALLSMQRNVGTGTISEFLVTVQDAQIREVLKQYCVDAPMGHLFDADEDTLSMSKLVNFEMDELLSTGPKYCIPVLLYLFRRIERALKGQPAMIVLDEAWIMLGNPVFRTKIREWLKTLRRSNCAVVMATQNLSDASSSGILDVILESTATKIFLPNPNARHEQAAELYTGMGLNPTQIDILAAATPKQDYYVVADGHSRLIQLALGPFTLAFIGASDKQSIADAKQIEATHGIEWIDHWLRHRGIRWLQKLRATTEEQEVTA